MPHGSPNFEGMRGSTVTQPMLGEERKEEETPPKADPEVVADKTRNTGAKQLDTSMVNMTPDNKSPRNDEK